MGMIFVTHDLGVAAEIADTVAVMYAGRIVESGPVAHVLKTLAHPYTAGLLASTVHGQRRERDIDAMPGSPPTCAASRRDAASLRAVLLTTDRRLPPSHPR